MFLGKVYIWKIENMASWRYHNNSKENVQFISQSVGVLQQTTNQQPVLDSRSLKLFQSMTSGFY